MEHIYTTPTTTQSLRLEIKLEDIHTLRVGGFTPGCEGLDPKIITIIMTKMSEASLHTSYHLYMNSSGMSSAPNDSSWAELTIS